MATIRKYRLSNTEQRDVDLRLFQQEITTIIEETVPHKHPTVYKDCFTTDELTQSEAVKIGRALSKNEDLASLGKTITTFRLFDGRTVKTTNHNSQIEGGRVRR